MSIEDIDFLYKNSIKESSIILIDSSKRDKDAYQRPNSYKITFNDPFKYVYGIEILDSSIPRTMYIIDKFNDTLVFYTSSSGEISIIIDHRDYTLDDLQLAIDEFYRILRPGGSCIIFFDMWKIETLSNKLTKFSKLRFIEWLKTI